MLNFRQDNDVFNFMLSNDAISYNNRPNDN